MYTRVASDVTKIILLNSLTSVAFFLFLNIALEIDLSVFQESHKYLF